MPKDIISEIASGVMEVTPDIAALPAGTDVRTPNKRILDAINAVIEQRANHDQQSYKINNRELVRTPLTDLLKFKAKYALLVRRERGDNGFREHKVVF